jgi:hypothetical protein
MYDERLGVPLRWWALATMFLASVLLAFLVAVPLWLALLGAGLLSAATVALLAGYGAARISVRDGVLTAGRARIATTHLGRTTPLDPAAARRLAGRDADARAFLLLRPYVRRAVRIDIADPSDATPYWLLSTRHPDRLVAALSPERADGVPPPRAG